MNMDHQAGGPPRAIVAALAEAAQELAVVDAAVVQLHDHLPRRSYPMAGQRWPAVPPQQPQRLVQKTSQIAHCQQVCAARRHSVPACVTPC